MPPDSERGACTICERQTLRHLTEIVDEIQKRNDMSLISFDPEGIVFRYRYVSLRGKRSLKVAASTNDGWDHVAISCGSGLPSWRQIDAVQNFLMRPHEWLIQLFAPHEHQDLGEPTTLHLWRPQKTEIPLPPVQLVMA